VTPQAEAELRGTLAENRQVGNVNDQIEHEVGEHSQ
jgi:hypothetical protein